MSHEATASAGGMSTGSSAALVLAKLRGLQARTTISYMWVTALSMLVIEAVLLILLALGAADFIATSVMPYYARQIARQYALGAAVQADGLQLDPQATFRPDQPHSLVPPGGNPDASLGIQDQSTLIANHVMFGLLIDPSGHVVATSYSPKYPSHARITTLLPHEAPLILQALAGKGVASTTTLTFPFNVVCSAAATVWSRDGHAIGAIYVQVPGTLDFFWLLPRIMLQSGLILLVIMAPIGGLFGLLTTRSVVERVRRLVAATTQFAAGHYEHQVSVRRGDEVGQLEAHFNQMAQQLAASIQERQTLAEQNARLAERARISRELHDAVSQDLFSLRMLAFGFHEALPADSQLHPQIDTFEETTTRMIREMRALLLELRPAQLEHLGLADALNDLAVAYSSRLGIKVTATVTPVALSVPAEHALLRIAQEALSNAVRHAQATEVTLALEELEQRITLSVTDNGRGFLFQEAHRPHGLGLRSMQERIQELHGSFTLRTNPGQGTQVVVSLPQKEHR